jgi:CotH protein.
MKYIRLMPLFACFILPWGLHRIQAQSGTSAGMALHQVFLDNISGTINADSPVTATFTIRDTVSDTRDRYRCLVTWRGSTSILYDKKSMKIAFINDETDSERDVLLPGLGRTDSKINLDAASVDRSHIRNRIAMELFNSYSRLPYATETDGRHGITGTYVQVWTDGRYSGLYCMTDRVNRKLLGVKKTKDSQVRGVIYKCKSFGSGSFLKTDGTQPQSGDSSWNAWEVKYPNKYPANVWDPLCQLMDVPWDTTPDQDYPDLVRQHFYWDNLVDLYLLTLVAGVADMGYKNSYLSLQDFTAAQRFIITPWDMDHSFGATYCGVPLIDVNTLMGQSNWSKVIPFRRLLQNPDLGFVTALANRWAQLRDGVLSVNNVSELIYGYADLFDSTGAWQNERDTWNYNPVTLGETARDEADYMVQWYSANHQRLDELLTPYITGVISPVQDDASNPVYDMQGRYVGQYPYFNSKGLYIQGNKKTLVR